MAKREKENSTLTSLDRKGRILRAIISIIAWFLFCTLVYISMESWVFLDFHWWLTFSQEGRYIFSCKVHSISSLWRFWDNRYDNLYNLDQIRLGQDVRFSPR